MTLVDIKLSLPDWAKARDDIIANMPGLIAATMQTNRGLIFDSEGKHNNHRPWKKLRCRDGQILSDRGTLRKSIAPMNDGVKPGRTTGTILRMGSGPNTEVTIGTNIAYAAIHNNGGVIRPKSAKALRFKCGNQWVFAKKVTIPKRPFNVWNRTDTKELQDTVANYLDHIMRSKL